MSDAPRLDSYAWRGGREAMLRFGPAEGPVVVLALPLFEEANRTRAFGVTILRALAARGVGGVFPELPGQGESEVATDQARLADLRAAFASVPGTHAVAMRSGALFVDERPCWLLAPQNGTALLRELARIGGGPLQNEVVDVAGNRLSQALLQELEASPLPGESRGLVSTHPVGGPAGLLPPQLGPGLRRGGCKSRIVRLRSDQRDADGHVDGPPLWRRAEPANDTAFAQTLATDIADWIASCES